MLRPPLHPAAPRRFSLHPAWPERNCRRRQCDRVAAALPVKITIGNVLTEGNRENYPTLSTRRERPVSSVEAWRAAARQVAGGGSSTTVVMPPRVFCVRRTATSMTAGS